MTKEVKTSLKKILFYLLYIIVDPTLNFSTETADWGTKLIAYGLVTRYGPRSVASASG